MKVDNVRDQNGEIKVEIQSFEIYFPEIPHIYASKSPNSDEQFIFLKSGLGFIQNSSLRYNSSRCLQRKYYRGFSKKETFLKKECLSIAKGSIPVTSKIQSAEGLGIKRTSD